MRRILCSLFLVAAVVAGVGAFASPRANQGSIRLSNALPDNILVVTNTNDSGPGSLRGALAVANNGNTIDLDSSLKGQTITLTTGQLIVDKDVTIIGPGANDLAVDGNAQDRVFYINPGKTVTISGLTITNGNLTNEPAGGIYNDGGALTLNDCTVSGNSGGSIINDSFNGSATMTVTNSTISGNFGGGIANRGIHSGATMTISNCTVSGNSGTGIGNGGAFGGGATLTVTNSNISGNSGGGIGNGSGPRGGATLTVSNCTVSGNSGGQGGGIANGDAAVTITNSTLSGNSADWGGGIATGSGQGGGAIVTVSNSTVSGNSANYGGGGIYNAPSCCGGSIVTVSNSTISGNSAVDGGDLQLEQRRRRSAGARQRHPEGGQFGRKHLQCRRHGYLLWL